MVGIRSDVIAHQRGTPTARYADILLPATSAAEPHDVIRPWPSGPFYAFISQAIEPIHERKSDNKMVCELAERMGFMYFTAMSDDEWLRVFIESMISCLPC